MFNIFCRTLVLSVACELHAQLPAFPGAEGFGKFASGGRGGTVYHVTTLADSGAGSFRDACSVSGRTIVFDVGGIIDYSGSRFAPKPNITIAGQTAPGDGITIYGNGLSFSGANNNIVRFIRVREGVNGDSGTDAMGIANGNTMIFDHITSSWGRDETFSISGSINNITIQSAIISQGLQGHSAGGLIQTDGGVSILRTLYIDNDTRNPKVKGVNEYVNNVVCNWETIGYNMGGDSSGESFVNNFNNYFMRGQASSSSAISGGNTDFHIYATNNWYDGNHNGVLDGSELPFASYGSMDLKDTPFAYPIITAYSPLTALKLAISDAGPSFRRDSVDELMMTQLASWGLLGGTITSELVAPMNGPGIIRNGTPYTDTDQDGMPDFWENGTGSNPAVANNNDPSPSGSGYTRFEDYLNWLAEPHGIALMNTNVVVDLRQFTRGWVVVNHSPVWSVSTPVNGAVTLTNDYMAFFTPTVGLNSNASFSFTVSDADGSPVTRTMNLFFTPSAQGYKAVWHGDDLANNWNTLGDFNWHDGTSLLYQFHAGEAVAFDDTGSTNPAVNLIGSLQPASVTINATKSFAWSGGGSLNGTMTLNKTNTGTLTINTTNDFSGATTVSNGTILVDGALNRSAVTVKTSGTIGGSGRLGNAVTIQSGGNTSPGNGIGGAGTLTISNSLTLANNVTHRFDISDDPTGAMKTNDQINVVGTLSVTGTNFIRVNLLDGPLLDGTYTLFKYNTLVGSLANFVLINANGVLTNPPGQIAIHVDNARLPGNLKWIGNGVNNNWDNSITTNWLNAATPDVFYFFDSVLFDDTGSTNPAVNLIGSLTPQAVTFDATKNYTVSGSGSISGYGTLTKTNSGMLAITAINDYAGATTLGGGVLSVAQLANGGIVSPIGAADSSAENLDFTGGTLRYTGASASTDRGATFDANANFEVTSSGTTLTWNGGLIGSGALQKNGSGNLTLSANNTFTGGTIVSNGTLALFGPSGGASITANNYALGSGPVTLYGGTLKLFGGGLGDAGAGYGAFSRPIEIPANATVTILTPARYTMSSKLTGGGTLNLEVNYVRGTMSGNWSEFTGTINITAAAQSPGNGFGEFRVANSSGYTGATIFLNNGSMITQSGSATLMEIGALGGTSGGIVGPGNSTSSGRSFRVGWNNQDATFAGQILADGANTVTKVGTGNWTLTGANTYNGGTIVDGGTLTVNNSSGSGTGSGSVTVNTNAVLTGNGIISGAVTINSGAMIAPGASVGTLTINNSVTLGAGSSTLIEINKTSLTKDLLDASGTLTYGGTLIVTNLSGILTNGDSFKIFDAGTYTGSFASSNLPPLASDLRWNTTTLNTSGTISVVSTNFTGPQPLIWVGDGSLNIWDTGTSANWITTNGVTRAFLNGDSVTFDNSGANTPAINLAVAVTPAVMTVNASQDYTIAGSGALTGTMPLVKAGSGKLILVNTSANTFSGGTTVSGGTLQIGDGVSGNGTLPGSVTNNATLIYANVGSVSSAAVIRGNGTLVKNGAGALTFAASQPYTGPTDVNAGSITFNGTPPASDIANDGFVAFVPNAAATYSKSISGSGSVSISGSAITALTGTNTFTGNLTNTSGFLVLTNNRAAGAGTVVYTGGFIVPAAGMVITNNFSIPTASASDLQMMATNSGTAVWAGNLVNFNSSAQWRPGSDGGTLMFTGNALLGTRNLIVPRGTFQIASNAIVGATGSATAFGRDTSGGNRSASVTIRDNAVVTFGVCSLGGNQAGGNVTLTIQDNAVLTCGANNFDLQNVNRTSAQTFIRLNGGTFTVGGFTKTKTSQTNVIQFNGGVLKAGAANASFLPAFNVASNWVQAGGAKIDDGGSAITIGASLIHDPVLGSSPDGGLTKAGAGTLTLSGVNSYTGATLVNAGVLALSGGGAAATIGSSTNINVAAGAQLDVTGQVIGFGLAFGQSLTGNGSVKGNVQVFFGVLAPGSNSIGTLTFSNSLSFASGSKNFFEISHSPLTNDVAKVFGALINGGTLVITNLSGALAAGDSFKLFDAASYSGSFGAVILPPLSPGLLWTNQLSTSGTIAVIANPPVFSSISLSSGEFILSGSNGPANENYYVLSSTNIALPTADWTRLVTNQFNGAGAFNFTNPVAADVPQKFYRLQLP